MEDKLAVPKQSLSVQLPESPVEHANIFSRSFYLWLNPVFALSRKVPLTEDNIFNRPSVEGAKHVTDRLENCWNAQCKNKHPSFFKAIFKSHLLELILTAFSLAAETICITVRPFLLNRILTGFEDMSLYSNRLMAIIACIILLATTLLALFLRNYSFWMTYRMGMRSRVAASDLVYKKILRLNQKALTETAAGQVINLLSTDAQRFELSFMFIHYGWVGPLQAVFVFWLMGEITLYPTLCAAAVMVLFIPMQSIMNRTYAKLRIKIARITDSRIRILSDLINGIKIIKLHTWEPLFSAMVHRYRKQETRLFLFVRLCQAFQFTQLVYQVKVTTMVLLLAIVFFHNGPGDPPALMSNQLYTLLNYLNALFLSLTLFLPMCIQSTFDTSVTCTRIQKFLVLKELEGETLPEIVEYDYPKVHFDGVTAYWGKHDVRPTLSKVSFKFEGSRLLAVVGAVGSGKSSLLQAILGELPIAEGSISRSPDWGYLPQTAWIFPGTVRENVLGSLSFDQERYERVLRATTLDVDIARLSHGDQTQVGERGVSMSGGQRARIGLARLAYDYSRAVLLDDPLAAVDARVANHLFNECICGILSDRLRILVTHQHHLLPQADLIIVMTDGAISHVGTYKELTAQGVDFHAFEIVESKQEPITVPLNECDLLGVPEDSHTEQAECPSGVFTSSIPNLLRSSSTKHSTKIWRRERSITQSSDHIVVNPWKESVSDCSVKRRHSFNERLRHGSTRASTRSIHATGVSQESITSRLAFSMENAVAPGIVDWRGSGLISGDPNEDITCAMESDPIEGEGEGENVDTAEVEQFQRGSVSWRYYLILGRIGGGYFGVVITMLLFILTITNYAGCDVWIAKWALIVDERSAAANFNGNITFNETDTEIIPSWDIRNNRFSLMVYCVLVASLVVLSSLRSLSFFAVLINSAKRLHNGMMRSCLNTRLRFFEINTSGRILNRFSKDIGQIDDYLPTTIHDFLQCFFLVISIGVVTIISSYWIIIPSVPLLFLFYITRKYYLHTSRDLKRIESVARSPMFSWVNVTIQGLACIRAAGNEAYHLFHYERLLDEHTSVFYMNIAAARWLSIRLDLLCFVFIASVVVICLLLGIFSTVPSADVGLMITYATGLVGLFQWCVRQSAEVENQMVSVERTVEYMDLEPELTKPPIVEPPKGWPSKGKIVFDRFWLRYSDTAPWALRNICLEIKPGMKVGVVGRTGAGKSSLISAIFRLVEAEEGTLLVDDVDVLHVELRELRKRISIIPQDPIMFSGTIKSNMDPDGKLDDKHIWEALDSVQIGRVISKLPAGLDSPITEGGANFSTGQRQLLALARAILGGNRILVIDEATANVDPGTDAIIQKTLRSQFKSCTVLTVAHRLQTVIDNDLLVVMESGRIVENGSPHELLNPQLAEQDRQLSDPNITTEISGQPVTGTGALANLVLQTGPKSARLLAQLARKAYLQSLKRAILPVEEDSKSTSRL